MVTLGDILNSLAIQAKHDKEANAASKSDKLNVLNTKQGEHTVCRSYCSPSRPGSGYGSTRRRFL